MKKIIFLCLMGLVFFMSACQEQALIPALPAPVVIAVAPYNQPTHEAQLLAGYIPSEQGLASAADLAAYDELLQEKLAQTRRHYIFLTLDDLKVNIQKDSKGRANVLATWAKIAQDKGADYILIPQILEHEEKYDVGGDIYSPARLISDFYFVKAIHPESGSKDGFLQARSHYKEISFIKVNASGEDYVTPRQHLGIIYFVNESIHKMIHEFHLTLE